MRLALAHLLFIALIGHPATPIRSAAEASSSTSTAARIAASIQQRETVYAYGRVYVRTGPGASNAIARTLSRGDQVEVGPRDAHGWARVYDTSGQTIGYVYLAGTRLRATPPSSAGEPSSSGGRSSPHRSERSAPGGATAICRDGSYSYSAHHRGTCSHHGGVAQWL